MNLYDAINSLDKIEGNLGGGSAAALAGAMSASILNLVARLSKGKDCGLEDNEYDSIMKETSELYEKLKMGAIDDDNAYGVIVSAYKLPKNNEEEKTIRTKAISDAGYYASKVPSINAINCNRLYELANYLEDRSNPNTSTDLYCALNLSKIAIEGCIMNVEVNFNLIKDQDQIEELKQIVANLGQKEV